MHPALTNRPDVVTAMAAAGARLPSATVSPLELPDLDELKTLGLADRRAKALEHALIKKVGERVHVRPSCPPAELRDRTELKIPFEIKTPDEQSASAVLAGAPQVATGAPLDPAVMACVVGRLGGVLALRSEREERFLSGFTGVTTVTLRLP